MVFTAKLLRGSPIWRLWRQHARTGGEVAGVPFRWAPGDDYVTEALDLEQINRLRGVAGVVLEAHGHGTPEPQIPMDEPDEPDEDESQDGTAPVTRHLSKRERRALRQQSGQPHV